MTGTVQGALFGDPAIVETTDRGPAATQDPREVARIVGLAQDPGLFLVERSGLILRADPARPGCADAVARHDGDTAVQLLDTGHLRLGGTHHLHHHGSEGPARSILVPKATRDMVSRWDHLRPIRQPTPQEPETKAAQRSTGLIGVDVVAPGKALVVLGNTGQGGTVLRDAGRYRVENDHGVLVGHASSYRAAARLLARYHGYTPGRSRSTTNTASTAAEPARPRRNVPMSPAGPEPSHNQTSREGCRDDGCHNPARLGPVPPPALHRIPGLAP